MMKDYSERRQSRTAAPPKRPSVWPYLLLILLMLLFAYAAGLGTGWYLYRPGGRLYKAPQIPQPAAQPKSQSALPPQGAPIAPAPPQQPGQSPSQGNSTTEKGGGAPPLTFYKTLQKGNKELMGTGINQPKELQQNQPAPSER